MTNAGLLGGIINVAMGAALIYQSKHNTEKLGKKAKGLAIAGIAFILMAVIIVILD